MVLQDLASNWPLIKAESTKMETTLFVSSKLIVHRMFMMFEFGATGCSRKSTKVLLDISGGCRNYQLLFFGTLNKNGIYLDYFFWQQYYPTGKFKQNKNSVRHQL